MSILKQQNISICYETHGDAANPCVLLVMGITGQLISWPNELIRGLADAGFYVVTFDNRDVGLSTYYDDLETPDLADVMQKQQKGELIDPPYKLNDMAKDILVLMDGLQVKQAHVVGVSMGGQIAQILAIEHPERLLSLTLISTSSGDPGLPPPKPEVLDFFFKPKESNTDLDSSIMQHVQQYKIYNHPDDFDLNEIKAMHEKSYQRAYHPMGNQRQLLAMIFAEPRGEKLRSVLVPSLIIHGDYDPVAPMEHGEHLAKLLPNSKTLAIEKMGHGLPPRACPAMVAAMIDHFNSPKT
jgi:pimeloyl-ACP methyl ester carboxylesterase